MDNKDNLLGVVATVAKWKKIILWTCGITAVGAIIVALLLPVYYESTTTFYAASPDLATPEAIYGNAGKAPLYYGTEGDRDRIISIGSSEEFVSFMVDSFNLYQRYDIDPDKPLGPYSVRLKFNKHFNITKTKLDAIELSVEDEDKEVAAQMANAAREYIREVAQRLIKESQAQLLGIFEENINQKQSELQTLNDTLQAVRQRFGIYNTLTQSESLTELIAKAEASRYNAQAKMEALQGKSAFRDSVVLITARIKGYDSELEQLNSRLSSFNKGMATVEVLKNTQVESSEKLAEDMEHYKQIKAAYDKEFPTILLLEEGAIPLIKSRPKRSLIVIGAVAVAFIFSIIGVILFDTYRDVNWREILHLKKD